MSENDQKTEAQETEQKVQNIDQKQEEQTPEEQIAVLKDQLMRAAAELENTRKRSEREKIDAHKYAVGGFAGDLLPVADNLRRALEAAQKEEGFDAVVEGLKLTEGELLKVFSKHGVTPVSPLHEKFDAQYHQAMFEVPTDEHPEGTVVELMQTGYVIHDRLLRPALVGVSKKA